MELTLDQQHEAFIQRRFIAMPIAGMVVWGILGAISVWLPVEYVNLAIFIGTGSILYLGMFLSKFTGENFFDKSKPKNKFDSLFLMTVLQALLVYSVAIPFCLIEPTSLPMTIGVLAGLMWVPFSWMAQHWVGLFHGMSRTILIVGVWYAFPDLRYVLIPLVIVVVYVVTIVVLEKRWRDMNIPNV